VNSLPKTVTRQRRGCDLNTGFSAPESSTLTTRLPSRPSHARTVVRECCKGDDESQWEMGKFDPPPHKNLCNGPTLYVVIPVISSINLMSST